MSSCGDEAINEEEQEGEASLTWQFEFDPNQERLNNLGLPTDLAEGHAGVSPDFKTISAHYLELAPTAWTQLGEGVIIYQGAETQAGGEKAIEFEAAHLVAENEVFQSFPFDDLPPGEYQYIRVSLSYQNYAVPIHALGFQLEGNIASFLGYNTYIESFVIKDSSLSVNQNKKQGFWAVETPYNVLSGDASLTTVPNPIASTSPIPAGSCLLTAELEEPLIITGEETTDKKLILALSTNKSFEWIDDNGNDKWEPLEGELIVDMGVRGMKARVE